MKVIGIVDICGLDYEVVEATPKEFAPLRDAYGMTDPVACRIYLRKDMPTKLAINTLTHEAQHGIWKGSGLEELCMQTFDKASHFQETFIQTFTPHLLAFLSSVKKVKFT